MPAAHREWRRDAQGLRSQRNYLGILLRDTGRSASLGATGSARTVFVPRRAWRPLSWDKPVSTDRGGQFAQWFGRTRRAIRADPSWREVGYWSRHLHYTSDQQISRLSIVGL